MRKPYGIMDRHGRPEYDLRPDHLNHADALPTGTRISLAEAASSSSNLWNRDIVSAYLPNDLTFQIMSRPAF